MEYNAVDSNDDHKHYAFNMFPLVVQEKQIKVYQG